MGNTHSEVVSGSRNGGLMASGHNKTTAAAFGGECGSSSGDGGRVRCDGSESLKLGSDVEERIESSKAHWSELQEQESDVDLDDEEVAQKNRQVFEELQLHPTWGHFLRTFGYDTKNGQRFGELVVKEKFAEGGQAELFHAKVIWRDSWRNENDLKAERQWVLKVFKKGTCLNNLQSQLSLGYLQWRAQHIERLRANLPSEMKKSCDVNCGTLLEDGRFAFLMGREFGDLRSRIDRAMLGIRDDQGPFSKKKVEIIMFRIAEGMDWLHSHNIVHRDLKAANVLLSHKKAKFPFRSYARYYVADFECSIGVVGTGFFRAPEILQAVKDKVVEKNQNVFSKEAAVYSYGMTYYEVLTGKLPFQGHPLTNYDIVLNGQRPSIPKYVDSWIRELLNRCWDVDCSKRPSFPEILEILASNSNVVRRVQLQDQKDYEKRLSQGLIADLK